MRHKDLDHPPQPPGPPPAVPEGAPPPGQPAGAPHGLRRRWHHRLLRVLLWSAACLAGLLLLLVLLSHLLDEPLRRSLEGKMNQRLNGYSVTLGHAHLQPLSFALTLRDLIIRQQANPLPPVAVIARFKASVQWRELLTGHLVADVLFDRPRLHLNLPQLRRESADRVSFRERGWQQALEAIYPLKCNLFEVRDGELTYVDEDPAYPYHITHIQLSAGNIRNIHSPDRVYPSPIHVQGIIFDQGRGQLDGNANFLSEPFPGVHALFRLMNVELDKLRPIGARSNLSLRRGSLGAHGEIEFAPSVKLARVDEVLLRGVQLDYIHSPATDAKEKAQREAVASAARQVNNKPGLELRLETLHLVGGEVGWVNRAQSPAYRLFVSDAALDLTNLSNHSAEGPARFSLRGRFMGTGRVRGSASFQGRQKGPDLTASLAIEETQLAAMNDVLRAYGKLDVSAGVASVYTELHVHDGRINGYVKPLFSGIQVYDPKKDKDKPVLHKVYEHVVGGLAKLLENRRSQDVATRMALTGQLDSPRTNLWEIIGGLLRNAFFKAILPGFERQAGTSKGR